MKSNDTKTAFVLLGGKGTRLRSMVSDRPKPMAMVIERPFLEHLLDYWISQGVGQFVFCVGYMSEFIVSHFGNDYRGKVIQYSFDEGELGTGGALRTALIKFPQQSAFLVLNGDTFFPIPLRELEQKKKKAGADWAISLFRSADGVRYTPVTLDSASSVLSVGNSSETTDQGTQPSFLVNGGVQLGSAKTFERYSNGLELPFSTERGLAELIASPEVRVIGLPFKRKFLDIGTPQDLARAQTFPEFIV